MCGRVAVSGTRCADHLVPARGSAHQRAARAVVAVGVVCWRCGEPARDGDPLIGGHLVDRARQGFDDVSNMAAEHRSCNGRAGAALTNAGVA